MRKIRSKEGSMPFAIIAVTILVIAGAYVSVCAYIEKTEDNINNISTEFDVFDNTADEIERAVNRGMGEIINEISRADGGSLMSRSEEFGERAAAWMDFQFPMSNGTVVIILKEHNVTLRAESLQTLSGTMEMETSEPVYLKASGTAEIEMSSSTGSALKNITISSDGASALPFLITQASLFELAIGGERSMLTQLISYQLASVVQYRAIQGYGAISEYGTMGTVSMITEKDVREAYNNAMAAIEMICFRSVSDGSDLNDMKRIDLAERMISNDGYIELDLTAIVAQTIASNIDDLVGKWAAYLMGDLLLTIIDSLLDIAKGIGEKVYNALVGLKNMFTKKETPKITASNHLKSVMSAAGYSESQYRRLTPNGMFSFTIPGGEYVIDHGDEKLSITIDGGVSRISSPDRDILSWGRWDGFLDDYRKETNSIKESIRSLLNMVCVRLASSYGLGTVKVRADESDASAFSSTLASALNSALSSQRSSIEDHVESAMKDVKFSDPMYGAMFKTISSEKESLFRSSSVKGLIQTNIRNEVTAQLKEQFGGTLLDGSVVDMIVADQMASDEIADALNEYEESVEDRLTMFETVLNDVRDKGGVMKEVFALIIKKGLLALDVLPLVESKVIDLCSEMTAHLKMNSMDVLELPGSSEFLISDGQGGRYTEVMDIIRTDSLMISITSPTDGSMNNIHYTDLFSSDYGAAYSASFRVTVHADVSFTASSYSLMSSILGVSDASYSSSMSLDSEIIVPVMTGWALAGVDYEASHTLWKDLQNAVKEKLIPLLMKILEPLLKPLREFYRMVDAVFGMMGSVLMEVSGYAASLIQKLYEQIAGPMERLQEMFNSLANKFGSAFEEILSISFNSQTIGFRFYEFEMKVTMNAMDIYTKHKTVLKIEMFVPVSDIDIGVVLDIKRNEKKEYSFAGSASISADTWNLNVAIDPFMKMKKHILEINGTMRGMDIFIVMPEVVQYEMTDVRLSDIPAINAVLSNIPIPLPGMKGTIDAGLELKYNVPFKHGLIINEFESNPKGNDAGNEWIELYNSTSETIDIEGYRLVMNSADNKYHEIGKMSIGPMEHLVISIPKLMLNNSLGKKGAGECIVLLDKDDKELDKTPWKTDSKDDENSWQRKYDGSLEWVFKSSTKGKPNGGKAFSENVAMTMIKQCVIDAATESFGNVNVLGELPDVAELLKDTVILTIEKIIEMIAACVVEVSVFFEIRATDVSGSAGAGIRLSLVIGPELVEKGMKWMVNEIVGMAMNIANPSAMSPATIIGDDVHLRFTTFVGLKMPKFLGTLSGYNGSLGIVIQCNLSAICTLLGRDVGTWNVGLGLVIENIPSAFIPPAIKIDKEKNTDLWLIKGDIQRSS